MIREAVPADLVSIMRIARQGFTGDDRFGTVWFIKKLAEPGTECWVEDAGVGVIRGFIVLQKYAAGTIVRLIGTDKGCRRSGVASALLHETVTHKDAQAGAWVRVENTASRGTFERAGWKISVPTWAEPKKPVTHTGDWVFYVNKEK